MMGLPSTTIIRQIGWVGRTIRRSRPAPSPLERPGLSELADWPEERLPAFVRQCATAMRYLSLLGELPWDELPGRPVGRAWPGPRPAPRAPFVAAFLVKIEQEHKYMSRLRRTLVEHPALVWLLGFPLVPCDAFPWGFDAEASVPSAKRFAQVLRGLDNEALTFLLHGTVHLIGQELPVGTVLGDEVSLDTSLVIAWVRENNPKEFVADRFDKEKQPPGDPNCRLGCKRRTNQRPAEALPATPTTDGVPGSEASAAVSQGEYYWGYASGVVASRVVEDVEVVLAELTQPFNQDDKSYFHPLMARTEEALGYKPRFGALDAAFDAHYVYDYFHSNAGFAAVPLVHKGGHEARRFDEAGLPLCEAGLAMPLKSTFICRTSLVEHQKGRFGCPLLFPSPSAESCPIDHSKWEVGGCLTTMATTAGARIRYELDREGEAYKALYRQRTATERINSQAKELGLERPKLRNGRSIANHNTLTYVLINLRALGRLRARLAAKTT